MIRINLLQKDLRPSSRRMSLLRGKYLPFAGIGVLLVLVLLIMSIRQTVSLSNLKRDIASRRAENDTLKQKIALVNELTAKQKLIKDRMGIVETLDRDRFTRAILLDILSMNLPPKIWLSLISERGGRIHVEGFALSNFVISDYIASLENTVEIKDVDLRFIQKTKYQNAEILNFAMEFNFISRERLKSG